MTSPAFAVTHWLSDGETVTVPTSVSTTGELLITDLQTQLGVAAGVHCSVVFDGTVGATGADEITEMLSLTGQLIASIPLSGEGLNCENDENCGTPKVWPAVLPWDTQLELEGTVFVDSITSASVKVGYEIECTTLGVKITDSCTTAVAKPSVKNVASGVELIFNQSLLCSFGGAGTGDIEGSETATLKNGLTLSADDE